MKNDVLQKTKTNFKKNKKNTVKKKLILNV